MEIMELAPHEIQLIKILSNLDDELFPRALRLINIDNQSYHKNRMQDMGIKVHDKITYASSQETMCASCGEVKHTPFRRDEMGGYVCITCVNNKLNECIKSEGT